MEPSKKREITAKPRLRAKGEVALSHVGGVGPARQHGRTVAGHAVSTAEKLLRADS
jgi:hypothetical protein